MNSFCVKLFSFGDAKSSTFIVSDIIGCKPESCFSFVFVGLVVWKCVNANRGAEDVYRPLLPQKI